MLIKTCPAVDVKAVGDPADGVFEAIVSVFGNKDSYGDVVIPGAFTESLAAWKASGNPIPVYYSHRMDDPDFNIGHVLEAKEIDRGLWVKAQLDVTDPLPGSKAPQVHRLMKGGRLAQFSFAYDVQEAGMATSEELGDYFELRKLQIYEVGPTPIGANEATELLAVKGVTVFGQHMTAGMKAGRVLAAKHVNSIRTARDSLNEVLAAAELLDDEDQEKTSGTANGKDEGAGGVKSEDLQRRSRVEILGRSIELSALLAS